MISQDPDLNMALNFSEEPSSPPETENQNSGYKAQQISDCKICRAPDLSLNAHVNI